MLHMTSTPPTIADLQFRYCERAVQDQPLLQGFAHPPDGVFHFCPMMARAPGALTGFPMRSQPSLQRGPVAEACDKRLSVGLDEGRGCAAAKPRKIGNPFSWERFRPKKSLGSHSEDARRIRLPGAKQRDPSSSPSDFILAAHSRAWTGARRLCRRLSTSAWISIAWFKEMFISSIPYATPRLSKIYHKAIPLTMFLMRHRHLQRSPLGPLKTV